MGYFLSLLRSFTWGHHFYVAHPVVRADSILRPNPPFGSKLVIKMDRLPSRPVTDPPNLVRAGKFSLDRLLSHVDPGPAEESEAFVRLIYEQRHLDISSDRDRETRG